MARIVSAGDALDLAAQVLDSGGVAVIPTDTVYGIAARIDRHEAIDRIFGLKQRSRDKPLPVLVTGLEQARSLGTFSPEAEKAAAQGWPGPLTAVVPSIGDVSFLGGEGATIALRAPAGEFALELIARTGPLAATSANLSGRATPRSVSEIAVHLGDEVDVYIDAGALDSAPSQVISFTGPRKKILRP